jgi:hypothetical protein
LKAVYANEYCNFFNPSLDATVYGALSLEYPKLLARIEVLEKKHKVMT